MARTEKTIYSGKSQHASYDIVDMVYENRPARVLFSGDKIAAQSGIALDDEDELLFDYNQRFMEIIASLRPKKVLLIGGGVFTLPMALVALYPTMKIDVVELDHSLQALAEEYFGFLANSNIRIFISDGRRYINTTSELYDLIVLDAFNHTVVPRTLTTKQAIEQYAHHLKSNGVVAVNIISSYYGRNAEPIRRQYQKYHDRFAHVDIFPANRSLVSFWMPQNFILVAQSGKKQKLAVRFEALAPPTDV